MEIPDLGHRVRQARTARGLTQAQLAESAGISRTTVNQLENGLISDLGIRKVEAILELLGLSLQIEAPRPTTGPDYARMAATTASVSFATPLSDRDVLRVLVTGRIPKGKTAQVRKLLEEAPTDLIRGLLRQVGSANKPGRVEANVQRLADELRIPATRAARWKSVG